MLCHHWPKETSSYLKMFLSSALDAWPLQELQARSNALHRNAQIDVAYLTSRRLGIVHPAETNRAWCRLSVTNATARSVSLLGPLQPPRDAEWQRQHCPDTEVTLTQLPGSHLWGGTTPDPFVFPPMQLLQLRPMLIQSLQGCILLMPTCFDKEWKSSRKHYFINYYIWQLH